MLRFLTAGESHGRGLVVIVDGVPAGLDLDATAMTRDLRRRQGGYGRGRRMAIELDTPVLLGGVRRGRTTGAPVAITIENRDWVNWQKTMHPDAELPNDATGTARAAVTRPRPGHADLAGAIKYGHDDVRDVLERASARETAARVAAGAVARQILRQVGADITSHVLAIGPVAVPDGAVITWDVIAALDDDSPTRCTDVHVAARMIDAIAAARAAGDTLGGAFEVAARGIPPGLGSYVQWDRRLDGRLAQALMSIPAIKGVGIGLGAGAGRRPGSETHDPLVPRMDGGPGHASLPASRPTNHAGGLEGGVSNGEEIRVTAFMKPIATLMHPLPSVDLATLGRADAAIERSDVCAVPAASVVGEAMVAFVLADAVLERFGGDTVADLRRHYDSWLTASRLRFAARPGDASS
ncbi:MAG: chorismate synthase [Chloroflexota bacterium]|nr:chorismate synthase [Chloroflexota bacterium]